MATERDIESFIVLQLASIGWQPDPKKGERNVFRQSPRTAEEKTSLGRLHPDFILYANDNSKKATIVIEAKRPGTTLVAALEQGKNYAQKLSAPIVIATDGYRLKTWHMQKNTPLFYNTSEVDDLFSPAMANYFAENHIYESFSENQRTTKKELIGKFREANEILRSEGLDAGIIRFSEFANLMFLKLRLEGGGDINGHTWKDVENKAGTVQLAAVKSMLESLRKAHSGLFHQVRIRRPQNMEKLVEILSSFRLSGVRDDIKGIAFEHFIHSYTQGTKNDLGQYFTPRHIIKMMVDYLRPQLGETVYDPFCGTGGMLIECFRYIQQHIETPAEKEYLCKKTIFGRDNSSVARIAMMNMIMFGDGHSNIEQGDSYNTLEKNKHDIVIANIPFSQTTEYTEGYPVPPSSSQKNGDSIGVQHCLTSLKKNPNARAAIIVPIGFIHKNSLKAEREYLYNNFQIERIVELTPKCFNPYTEQQTAVLMLRQGNGKKAKPLYFNVRHDGFSQDGYRVPVPGNNDIDRVMEEEGGKNIEISVKDEWKYKKIFVLSRPGYARLNTMAFIRGGDSISPKTMLHYTMGGESPIVMVADLSANHIDYCLDTFCAHINKFAIETRKPRLYLKNTIIIPSTGKAALLNHRALLDKPAYLTSTVTSITANENINPYYLFHWLLRWNAEDGTYDLGYPGLSPSTIGDILIPIVSESEENRIVANIADAVKKQREFKKIHRNIMANT